MTVKLPVSYTHLAYFVIGFDCQRNEIKRINTERKEKNKQKEESKL